MEMMDKEERNRALTELDTEWARTVMPYASSDYVRLVALHKARYECVDIETRLRLASGDWLRCRGFKRIGGKELLPVGVLPEDVC